MEYSGADISYSAAASKELDRLEVISFGSLPKVPAEEKAGVDGNGVISGLF